MRPRTIVSTAPRGLLLVAAVLVVAAVLAFAPRDARAQEIQIGRAYQVAEHGDVLRHLDEFERFLGEEEWERAAVSLQALFDQPADRGLVTRIDGGRFEGVHRVAQRLFAALPEPGRAAWEAAFREDAEALLERGLRLRRVRDLRDAARRYPARDIRRRAHEALASLALARGEFAAAAFDLRVLLTVSDDREERAGIFARIAFARAQNGDRSGVERVRMLAAPVLGEPVPGPEGAERLSEFLDRMEASAGPGDANSAGWPTFSGNASGTATSASPPIPGRTPQWRTATRYVEGSATDADKNIRWAIPRDERHRPVSPVVAQDMVIINNGLTVRAIDLSSGSEVWKHDGRQRGVDWRDNRTFVHTAAVADGVVYAAVATHSDAPEGMDLSFYGRPIVYKMPHRSLVALDARTGDVLWTHERDALEGRTDAAAVRAESVSSPPVVVGEDVLVTTWTYEAIFDVRLVCFERRTGKTRWRRSIAQGQQELNLFGRPVKELATTPLAVRDGVAYFGTGLGVVAAVDVAHGDVQWISAYVQTRIPASNFWYETKERPITWWPSPVVATASRVLMAPVESPYLLAFDRKDGTLAWSRANRLNGIDHDWFAGVTDNRAIIVGDRVTALRVANGAPAWNLKEAGILRESQHVKAVKATGAAVLTESSVVVPADDAIFEFGSHDGAFVSRTPLPEERRGHTTGNLRSGDGALLVVARDQIHAHYRFENRRDRLLERISRDPDDPQLRLEAGEIFRSAGYLDDAIAALEIGIQRLDSLAPRARDRLEGPLRRALHAAYLDRAGEAQRAGNSAAALADLERAVTAARDRGEAVRALFRVAELAPMPRRLAALERIRDQYSDVYVTLGISGRRHAGAEAMVRIADHAYASGDVARAVEVWLDVLERHTDADLGRTDVRHAVHERIGRARARNAVVVTERVRARAERAFSRAREAEDAGELERIARVYPDSRTAARAGLMGARLHLDAGRPRPALGLLRGLLSGEPEPGDAARALLLLANAYEALDAVPAARMTLQRLLRRYSDIDIDGTKGGDIATARLSSPAFALPERDIPSLTVPAELLWEATDQATTPQIVVLEGRRPEALQSRLLATRGGTLELLDASTGRAVWRQPLDVVRKIAAGTSEAVVIAGYEPGATRDTVAVQAFRASDGRPLWRSRLSGGYTASAVGLGVLYVLHAERSLDGDVSHTLSAVELASGDVLARRDFDGPVYPSITVCEDAVVVFQTGTTRGEPARTVATLDGATLALRGSTPLTRANVHHLVVHPPQSSVVVAVADAETLLAVNVDDGTEAWTMRVTGSDVKSVHAVPEGVIVADTAGRLQLVSSADGGVVWRKDLGSAGALGWQGEAAADGLVVATLVPPGSERKVVSLALDLSDGRELWRRDISLQGSGHPHPVICESHVAYELNDNLGREGYRSRIVILDRADGRIVQTIEHPLLSRKYQAAIFDRSYLALTIPGALAVYGR